MTGQTRGSRMGLIGLGAMGRNLGWRLVECGVPLAVYSYAEHEFGTFDAGLPNLEPTGALRPNVAAALGTRDLLHRLETPRLVLIMVTAGAPVDRVIDDLLPGLEPGDIVIDGGNSHFQDTVRRAKALRERGVGFLGVGISGGEAGARHGASLMVGGEAQDYARVRPLLELLAARTATGICAAHVGPDGAGHFVKMVHNGIEYALMQVIAEIWHAMQSTKGWNRHREQAAFQRFARGPAASYLVELTARILGVPDPEGGGYLLDAVSDRAAQKGTGRATIAAALDLGVAVPGIAAAVQARMVSNARPNASPAKVQASAESAGSIDEETLEAALDAGFVTSFAQGFDLLAAASKHYRWSLDLAAIAGVWQAGCIIRASLLGSIEASYRDEPGLQLLLHAPAIHARVTSGMDHWRRFVSAGVLAGRTPSCAAASLAWCDDLRTPVLPTRLIQAQRDAFGAHGFERVDQPGTFHASW